jgi:hypothetical protein
MTSNARPERGERLSIRVALAASMLRHGRDPHEIAQVTQVPLALVQLLAEHPTPRTPTSHTRTPRPAARVPAAPSDRTTIPSDRRTWWALVHLTAGATMIGNLGLAIAAATTHLPALGLAAVLLIAPLFAVLLLATIR